MNNVIRNIYISSQLLFEYVKRNEVVWQMSGSLVELSDAKNEKCLRRFKLDEPCYAVMTTPSRLYTGRCHPLEVRPFSYRENARFQTFPDDWNSQEVLQANTDKLAMQSPSPLQRILVFK